MAKKITPVMDFYLKITGSNLSDYDKDTLKQGGSKGGGIISAGKRLSKKAKNFKRGGVVRGV